METYKQILIILLFFFNIDVFSQNIVSNPSFEVYDNCPEKINQLHLCNKWVSTGNGASPDYFNSCSLYNKYIGYSVGVPNNFAGYQNSKTGDGYAGIVLLVNDDRYFYREYIQGELIEEMILEKEYEIEFFISLAESSSFYSDRISVCLSKKKLLKSDTPYSALHCENSLIIHDLALNDKERWISIRSKFIASGGEKYITIGVFVNDLTKKEFKKIKKNNVTLEGKSHCYYYIDDVSVTRCD